MTDIAKCGDLVVNSDTAQVVICAVSATDTLDIIQLLLMAISPIILAVGVHVATKNIAAAKETARKKATLDMIEKVESVPHYRQMHEAFSYHRKQSSFSRLHDPAETRDREERTKVLDYLNHYELVSIGIASEILDEDFYRNWMRGPFVRDWNAAADFIQRERWKFDDSEDQWIYNAQLFASFQTYAVRWSEEAKNISKDVSVPPATPKGPGDEAYPDGERASDSIHG